MFHPYCPQNACLVCVNWEEFGENWELDLVCPRQYVQAVSVEGEHWVSQTVELGVFLED
jgi:hypothetical protein